MSPDLQENVFQYKKYCQNIHQYTDLFVFCFTGDEIDHNIGDHTHCNTLGNTVHKRHCNNGNKARNSFCIVAKIDLCDRSKHHKANYNQSRSRCKGRNGKEDRRQEQRKTKQQSGYQSGNFQQK